MIGTRWREEKKSFQFPFPLRDLQDLLDDDRGRHMRDILHFWFPPSHHGQESFLNMS